MLADSVISRRFADKDKHYNEEHARGELIQLLDFLGIDRNTPKDALSVIVYYTCIRVLSESIGKMPIKVQKKLDRGVLRQPNHRLWRVLMQRPNRFMTATNFWSCMERARSHKGNAYAYITGAGQDTELWYLPTEDVEVYYDDAKIISDIPDVYYRYMAGGKEYIFKSSEIIHLRTSNTRDGIMGIPVCEQLRDYITGQGKAQDMLNQMYESGFMAKAVLQYTGNLNDDNVKKFVKLVSDYAENKYSKEGVKNFIPAPLGATIQPLNIKLADNEFAAIQQASALEIAAAFGIKPTQVGDYSKSSYSSEETQQISFYVETLLFIIEQYEQELTYKLFTRQEQAEGIEAKFDTRVILRVTQEAQMNNLRSGVSNFIFTPNEAREQLDLPAVEGGDKLIGNGTNIPIEMVGQQYNRTAQAEGGDRQNE